MRRLLIAAISVSALMAGLAIAYGQDAKEVVWKFPTMGGPVLALTLPSEVTSLQSPTKMDFQIVDFQYAGKTILSLYLGNAPQRIANAHGEKINGLPAQSVVVSDDAGISRDALVILPKSISWPTFAHFFYRGNSKAASAMADATIASFGTEPTH
jgi:hypothetical protein